jgi:type I restriction enzyme, S subunit
LSRVLPKGWVEVRLEDAVELLDFEREPVNSEERTKRLAGKKEGELYPYYGATGQAGWIDDFRSEGERVLLGEDGAPFLDPSRDKAYCVTGRFWVNNHAHVLQGVEALLDNRFLCHQLNTVDYQPHVSGSTRLKLTSSAMKRIPLVIAPRLEQNRIVEKLEELLSDLDAGVAELKAAQKKLALYRQSLLKAAVEGALTADWRARRAARGEPLETGADLLARILTERRARWEARQLAKFEKQGKTPPTGWQAKSSQPVRSDAIKRANLPNGWVWSTLGECFEIVVGATPSRKEASYWNGDIPWVSSGEVQFSRVSTTKERISDDGLKNSSTRMNPVGSVLLGMIGEGKTRGQVAILDIEAANNQNCAAIWVSETEVPPEYIHFWLWSRYEETRRGSSGNNQPALNKSIVEAIPFPLPPLDELNMICESVSTSLSQAEEQGAAIEFALRQSAAQRKNLLKAAFSGQLVPQDPNDEPASALLARIRAEREARSTGPARRTRRTTHA